MTGKSLNWRIAIAAVFGVATASFLVYRWNDAREDAEHVTTPPSPQVAGAPLRSVERSGQSLLDRDKENLRSRLKSVVGERCLQQLFDEPDASSPLVLHFQIAWNGEPHERKVAAVLHVLAFAPEPWSRVTITSGSAWGDHPIVGSWTPSDLKSVVDWDDGWRFDGAINTWTTPMDKRVRSLSKLVEDDEHPKTIADAIRKGERRS